MMLSVCHSTQNNKKLTKKLSIDRGKLNWYSEYDHDIHDRCKVYAA